jgi:hypothetical protein
MCEISLRGHILSLPRRFAVLGLELVDQVPTTWCVGKFLADDLESWTMVKDTLFHGRTNIFVNHTFFKKNGFINLDLTCRAQVVIKYFFISLI